MANTNDTLTIEYDRQTGKISLCIYDEGFFVQSLDITEAASACVIEKMFDDNDLDSGSVLEIRKKMETPEKIRFPLKHLKSETA